MAGIGRRSQQAARTRSPRPRRGRTQTHRPRPGGGASRPTPPRAGRTQTAEDAQQHPGQRGGAPRGRTGGRARRPASTEREPAPHSHDRGGGGRRRAGQTAPKGTAARARGRARPQPGARPRRRPRRPSGRRFDWPPLPLRAPKAAASTPARRRSAQSRSQHPSAGASTAAPPGAPRQRRSGAGRRSRK